MRGDEPARAEGAGWIMEVFPACAGMNRTPPAGAASGSGVPRMRGDEPPWLDITSGPRKCSPHARG